LVHRVRQCLVQLCALTGPVLQDKAAQRQYTERLLLTVLHMHSRYRTGRQAGPAGPTWKAAA